MRQSVWALAVLFGLSAVHPAAAEIVGTTDKQVQPAANTLLDAVFEGIADDNYAVYTEYFDAVMKESITPERFKQITQQINDTFGAYLYREYLGFLNKTGSTIVLWKGIFDRTANDVLIKLVISRRGEQHVITGLWFE